MNDYRIIPYVIHGVKLWALEDQTGFILCYCSTKQGAEERLERTKYEKGTK